MPCLAVTIMTIVALIQGVRHANAQVADHLHC
jgi:hypothetical protein